MITTGITRTSDEDYEEGWRTGGTNNLLVSAVFCSEVTLKPVTVYYRYYICSFVLALLNRYVIIAVLTSTCRLFRWIFETLHFFMPCSGIPIVWKFKFVIKIWFQEDTSNYVPHSTSYLKKFNQFKGIFFPFLKYDLKRRISSTTKSAN